MPEPIEETRLETLARRFEHFGTTEIPSSLLYARLARAISADRELLALAAHARQGQPVPLLFLAAVQFLLFAETSHPLAAFYPTLSPVPVSDGDPWPLFREFCLHHREVLAELLQTRSVQTNEVRRSACLLPAFIQVAHRNSGLPLALIEIGPSAGPNMLWDSYSYDYGEGRQFGDLAAPVQLTCELRGDRIPALGPPPPVCYRIGMDLNPVDVRNPDAVLWLRALIWPEHRERVQLFQAALAMAQANPPTILAGNALDLLPEVLPTVPPDAALCLYHSHVLYQFPPEDREQLDQLLTDYSRIRPVCRVSMEGRSADDCRLELITYTGGQREETLFAIYEAHGRWLEWQA